MDSRFKVKGLAFGFTGLKEPLRKLEKLQAMKNRQ